MHHPASPDHCAMTVRKMRRDRSQRSSPALELDKAIRGSQAEREDHDHGKHRGTDNCRAKVVVALSGRNTTHSAGRAMSAALYFVEVAEPAATAPRIKSRHW